MLRTSLRTLGISYELPSNPLVIGVSDVNDYVPLYFLTRREVVTGNSFTYNKPKFDTNYRAVRNVADFGNYLLMGWTVTYNFRKAGIIHQVVGFNGNIIDSNSNFLLVFTIKSSVLTVDYSNHSVFIPNDSNELNPEHLKLFVSTELVNNPSYSSIYKKVYQETILPCLQKGMEVSYLLHGEIDKKLFNDGLNRNFETITDAMSYISPESTGSIYNYLTPLQVAPFALLEELSEEEVEDDGMPF